MFFMETPCKRQSSYLGEPISVWIRAHFYGTNTLCFLISLAMQTPPHRKALNHF